MKKFLLTLMVTGLCFSSQANMQQTKGHFNYNGVTPPVVNIDPDTIDGEGIVTIELTVTGDLEDFSYGYIIINNPDDVTAYYYNFDDWDLIGDMVSTEYKISKYDLSGYWYIDNITLYYYTAGYQSLYKDDINKGFVVVNTTPDTVPPRLTDLSVSVDTVYPGDTALITMEIEDTLSGLYYCYIAIYDTLFNTYYYDYEDLEGEKTKTLNIEYIPGKYESSGPRIMYVEIYDVIGNSALYNEDSLELGLVVSGTVTDILPPVLKSADIVNNSPNDTILLDLVMVDDVSGISSFYVYIYDFADNNYYFSFDDFSRVNDSLYRINIIDKYPYIQSGNYLLNMSLEDSAYNYNYYESFTILSIINVNSDSEAPSLISAEFDKDTLVSGDVITLEVIVTDNKSGINYFEGEISNTEDWRNSIWFEEYIDEGGITEYTYEKSFTLSEFGPGGEWELGYLHFNDHANLDFEQYGNLTSFYYYPKYLDDEPPVFDGISFDPSTVDAGDTVVATILASDNLSGLGEFDYYDALSDRDYFFGSREWTMTALNTYQSVIPINQYAPEEIIWYELYSISDKAGNRLYLDEYGLAFEIINEGPEDDTPPVFDSLHISETVAGQEDTLELVFYYHDDLSGVDPAFMYAVFDIAEKESEYEDYFDLILIPDSAGENSCKIRLFTRNLGPGHYQFYSMFLADRTSNIVYPDETDYLDMNYTFEITGVYEPDNDAPVLSGISIYPETAEPGDTVSIELEVFEAGSALLTVFANIKNSNGIEEGSRFFGDWDITAVNDSIFTCQTEYIVPENATNGKYIIGYIELYDYHLNEAMLEYGKDYTDACFMVTGGQSYPNRPPTWVIPDIYLTINANELTEYYIPEFLVADIDGDELSFSAVFSGGTMPAWIGFTAGELKLSFTPGSGDKGYYTIYIVASDPGGLEDALEVNIEVIGPDATDTHYLKPEFKIYPVPAGKYLYIDCDYNISSIMMYDFGGNLVYSCSENCKKISINDIEKGVYLIKVITDRLTYIEKLVIQ
jgi:hypothetical protein